MTYVLAEYPDSTPQYWVASCDPKVPSDALEGITQITPDTHLAPKMIWSGTDAWKIILSINTAFKNTGIWNCHKLVSLINFNGKSLCFHNFRLKT